MYTDSHFHLDHFALKGTVEETLRMATEAEVRRMIAIGGSDEANDLALQTAIAHPGTLWCTAGYDRDLCQSWDRDLSRVRALLTRNEVVAVGECGIDYFHKDNPPQAQQDLFAAMLDLAVEFKKPVVVHSRDADADTLSMLRDFSQRWPETDRPCAVLHCFTGNQTFAHALLDLNLSISFSGIVTFKNAADLREVARTIPDDRLLIETDSPYLAPEPHRGERNQPARVVHVAACLAELRNTPAEEIGHLTSVNAATLFALPHVP
jgi:TatD DNase family protein